MATGLLAVASTLGTGGAALATTVHPSAGGTWEYGSGVTSAWSYYTVNQCYGSSIDCNGSTVVRSVDIAAGYKSNA